MQLNPKIPIQIRLISWYLIFNGTMSLVRMSLSLSTKSYEFDPGIIDFIFGFALLRLSNWWRKFLLIAAPFVIVWHIDHIFILDKMGWPANWKLFGVFSYSISRIQGLTFWWLVVFLEILLWVILLLPSSRNAFHSKTSSA